MRLPKSVLDALTICLPDDEHHGYPWSWCHIECPGCGEAFCFWLSSQSAFGQAWCWICNAFLDMPRGLAIALPDGSLHSTAVVLDCWAPHLEKEVDELFHGLGHGVLRIGGGLTPAVQVEDTHAHRQMQAACRQMQAACCQMQAACSQTPTLFCFLCNHR